MSVLQILIGRRFENYWSMIQLDFANWIELNNNKSALLGILYLDNTGSRSVS